MTSLGNKNIRTGKMGRKSEQKSDVLDLYLARESGVFVPLGHKKFSCYETLLLQNLYNFKKKSIVFHTKQNLHK